ncbi:MAG TPA: 2-oxo-4-hydroxy-4-carboxy-5-ureidoimidazoline decarboxylase [Candidatus Pelagibacter sp.]|jgi:OHCU decarboxylase|nr:2-oxo-4-hydroxy-4-carboxy-5-ureidoimidazoline decarboxylase [Candidatus Pelagibacter sp.]
MLNKINKLSKTEFTEVFGNIFENASWIAERLYEQKPFKNFKDMSKKMISIFEGSNNQNKLKIIISHLDLADQTKIASLTADSNKEQNNAGLDLCTKEEFSEFKNLNLKYKSKFGFPFILAVKGKNKLEILINFKKRILSDKQIEFDEAIKQVKQIANLRLNELKNKFI